jgi:TfoX/Sxy family transcriptional regulator of competence genes
LKLYDEETMKELRESFEEEILQRPNVKTKRMFGCPSYTVKDKLFAFLVTDGLVMTNLPDSDREVALERLGAQPFEHNQRVVKRWVRIPVTSEKILGEIMPFVMKSYETSLEQAV